MINRRWTMLSVLAARVVACTAANLAVNNLSESGAAAYDPPEIVACASGRGPESAHETDETESPADEHGLARQRGTHRTQ